MPLLLGPCSSSCPLVDLGQPVTSGACPVVRWSWPVPSLQPKRFFCSPPLPTFGRPARPSFRPHPLRRRCNKKWGTAESASPPAHRSSKYPELGHPARSQRCVRRQRNRRLRRDDTQDLFHSLSRLLTPEPAARWHRVRPILSVDDERACRLPGTSASPMSLPIP